MRVTVRTAGLTLAVRSDVPATSAALRESFAGQERPGQDGQADLELLVEDDRRPYDVTGWEPLTRGAWCTAGAVVLQDACSSGYDLRVEPPSSGGTLVVRARRRHGARDLAQARLLAARHHLLVRAVLVQYPALWWSGVRGRVPLHTSVLTVGPDAVLLAGPGGTGKSTLLRSALAAGGRATCDNVAVSDGGALHGLLEPVRAEGGTGRRMPHGRREDVWAEREDSLLATRALVVRRGVGERPVLRALSPDELARTLAAGTYAAGELRRYWAFAATLALGTGRGPAHPPVVEVARHLAGTLRCEELVLPGRPGTTLHDVLAPTGVPA